MEPQRIDVDQADLAAVVGRADQTDTVLRDEAGDEVAAVISMAKYRELQRLRDEDELRTVRDLVEQADQARAAGAVPPGVVVLDGPDDVRAYFAAMGV